MRDFTSKTVRALKPSGIRKFFDIDEAIGVYSEFLDMFDIDHIVITGFSLTQSTESNYQAISVSAISDTEYDIYSEEY